MTIVKCLSLWQPWASLWCSPAKVHETRHWPLSHRGWLLVHAAKRPIDKVLDPGLESICTEFLGADWRKTLPHGGVIGMVYVTDCLTTEAIKKSWGLHPQSYPGKDAACYPDFVCGNFDPRRYGFERGGYQTFPLPIPFRGLQGIFHVPRDLLPVGALKELGR